MASDNPEDRWVNKQGKRTPQWGKGMRYLVRVPGFPAESFPDKQKEKARERKRELLNMRDAGKTPVDPHLRKMVFEDYSLRVVGKRRYASQSSRNAVERVVRLHLNPFFGKDLVASIATSSVDAWLDGMHAKLGKTTHRPLAQEYIRQCYSILGMILKSAVVDNILDRHPFNGVADPPEASRNTVEHVWEQETVAGLLDAVPDREHGIPLLASAGGLRPSETYAVARETLNLLTGELIVQHKLVWEKGVAVLAPPKQNSVRTVPIGPTVCQQLAAHMQRYPSSLRMRCACCGRGGKEWTLLFFTEKGLPINPRSWHEDVWHPALRAMGIKPNGHETGLYQLRHFCASWLIASGLDANEVAAILGHPSITTTLQHYVHQFNSRRRRAADVMESLFVSLGEPARVHSTFTNAEADAMRAALAEALDGPWARRPEAAALLAASQKLARAIQQAQAS